MPSLRPASGREVVKILTKHYGFAAVRQRGSHVVLRKETPEGAVGTVVPMHAELKPGTLRGVLKLARVDPDDFVRHL